MDTEEFTDALREAHETPLSRLGSSKSLYALTGGEMAGDAVRAAVAREATLAAETYDDLAAATDGETRTLLSDLAASARDQAETAGTEPTDRQFPDLEALAATETDAGRLGGALARQLLAETRVAQAVGFFVGDADPQSAQTFRSLRSAVETDRDRVAEALAGVDDRETAREAADAVIEAAYEDYVESLESMGVEPKNVC
ncbi:transcription antitermination protein [Halobaculum sp. MBLA0143]|uniref:transcription antitermination protein n=1 Tax=Halobaculum sp. MBLA0143 TaxID=3079933 RepID=UPI00352544D3